VLTERVKIMREAMQHGNEQEVLGRMLLTGRELPLIRGS
jgi:hypothetical protein